MAQLKSTVINGSLALNGSLSTTLNIFPNTNNYTEGIRIHPSSFGGWSCLAFCSTTNTGDSGTDANSWNMTTYGGNFYLSKGGSSTSTSAIIANINGQWSIRSESPIVYLKAATEVAQTIKVGSIVCSYSYALESSGEGTISLMATAGGAYIRMFEAGTFTGGVASNGTLITASSREKKKNILPLKSFGDEIDRLNLVSFNYKWLTDAEISYGLIYEDTIDILPYICNDNLEPIGKTISYDKLIPIMLKEIQDLRKRVKELEEMAKKY